jgi:hypothetical protein
VGEGFLRCADMRCKEGTVDRRADQRQRKAFAKSRVIQVTGRDGWFLTPLSPPKLGEKRKLLGPFATEQEASKWMSGSNVNVANEEGNKST